MSERRVDAQSDDARSVSDEAAAIERGVYVGEKLVGVIVGERFHPKDEFVRSIMNQDAFHGMATANIVLSTTAMEVGIDIDGLREELRRHLLERAQSEFDNPRPHQYAYSNDLLDELVRTKPRTKNALGSITGMGPWRMESSEGILRIIDEWLMRRCVHAIEILREQIENLESDEKVSFTPQGLDQFSEHFVEWARGRDEPPKRISSAEAKAYVLESLSLNKDARVSELRGSLADRGMSFSPSRLSQIITSMVDDGLIVRKKPVPFEKGVVILEITRTGLSEWEAMQ